MIGKHYTLVGGHGPYSILGKVALPPPLLPFPRIEPVIEEHLRRFQNLHRLDLSAENMSYLEHVVKHDTAHLQQPIVFPNLFLQVRAENDQQPAPLRAKPVVSPVEQPIENDFVLVKILKHVYDNRISMLSLYQC